MTVDHRTTVGKALNDPWFDEEWIGEMYERVVVRGQLGIKPKG